jgi:hypothetical protein
MVPDEKTAILIAEAVLVPIYGEKEVKEQAPWSVNLKNGIWVLKGRLKAAQPVGGNLNIKISKKSGCILRIVATE